MLKFVFYNTGEIELVEKDINGVIVKYVAYWHNKTELDESMKVEAI